MLGTLTIQNTITNIQIKYKYRHFTAAEKLTMYSETKCHTQHQKTEKTYILIQKSVTF